MTAPDPLTPADCDLRSVPSMLLDVQRFRDSDLVVLEKPEAVLAAILLWGASWHQVPAASLPDDDRLLAQLAGYGKVVSAWKKVRAGALRGFVKCTDGRLYHPVVADKACEMWEDKLQRLHGRFCATIRKHNERKKEHIEAPTFEDWLRLGRPDKVADIVCEMPDCHADSGDVSRGQTPNVAREIASNRTEQNITEQNTLKPEPKPTISGSIPKPEPRARARARGADCFNEVCIAADWRATNDTQRQNAISIIDGWLALGCTLPLILDAIAKARKRDPAQTKSLKRFDSTIRGIRRDQLGGELPATAADVEAITSGVARRLAVGG